MRMPSIKDVAAVLARRKPRKGDIEADRDGDCYMDVRLQVYEDGSWSVRTGDSSYDQDHCGYWGASSMDHRTNCRELARELIDQCAEDYAMSRPV